jgi:ribokinase
MKYDVLSLGPARMDAFVGLPEEEINEVCTLDRKRCMIEMGFGEKIAVKWIDFSIGGNSGNNAVGITRLGFSGALVGSVGDGWTDKRAVEVLSEEGVETKYIEVKPGQKGFGVIINYQGERTILSYYSHSSCCFPEDETLDASWVYLTSMGEGFESFYKESMEWAESHKAKVAFNPGTRQIKAGFESLKYAYEKTDVLFVNKEEAETILKLPADSEVKKLLTSLRELGPKVAVITDGPGGTYLFDGNVYLHMPIVEAPVVERTGAGDAFGSGYLGAILAGKSPREALRWGTVNSASVLGFVGPQKGLLTQEGIQEWLEKSEDVMPVSI